MKHFYRTMAWLGILGALLVGPVSLVPAEVSAVDPQTKLCEGVTGAGGYGGCNTAAGNNELPSYMRTIVNVLLFITGAVAVIMIIIGGFRYVLSGGDQSSVTSAKNTILYAVIGLIVAILAYAIVNFVIGAL